MMAAIASFNMLVMSFGYAYGVTSNTCASKISSNYNKENNAEWSFIESSNKLILVLFFFSTLIAFLSKQHIFSESKNSDIYFTLVLISGFCGAMSQFYLNGLLGFKKVKEVSIITTLSGLLMCVLLLSMLFAKEYVNLSGVYFVSLLAITNLSCFVCSVIFFNLKVKDFNKKKQSYKIVEAKEYIVKTLFPTVFNNGLLAFVSWFVLIIISKNLGVHQVGLFSTLLFLINIVLFVPRLSSNLILSRLIHSESSGNVEKIKQFLLGIVLNCFIISALYFIFYFNEKVIISFYRANFDNIYELLNLMFIGSVFIVTNNMFAMFFISEGKAGYAFWVNLVWSIVYITLVYLSGDIESIAFSYLASYVFLFLCNLVLLCYAFPEIRRSIFEKCTRSKYGREL
ncbi:TPA: hypothetical protein NKQ37_002986 [Vibrio parahaemolyticus]|nr:hypothetical protein [Vibrio parahaemolyticus]MCC4217650.1 hypothetical protein [Vibrio parahaemolyticus]TOH82612.1 hypothetical protein CGI73_13340 [Vibrio parahaemolyticus]TOI88010.1 hypothetical protein CGI51_13620 [Vibrio parahaemolyticus]HCG6852200.1 hypothetical protein [Vibrio parahaemolyticus]HCH1540758.1 hypothetical protein [Vibrio parahaemolyticus]